MAELTKEQIEQAAEAVVAKTRNTVTVMPTWEEMGEDGRESVRRVMVDAAPHLQLPWNEPSPHETDSAWELFKHICPTDQMVRSCMVDFVRRRNAALLPKTVDPRADALHEVLVIVRRSNAMSTEADFNKATSDILRLLDEREISLDEVK